MSKKENPFNTKFNAVSEELQQKAKEAEQQNRKAEEPQTLTEVKAQNTKAGEPQNRKIVKGEVYTDKISVYFSPAQTEKLALLAIEYKKRTGKRIATNEIIRRVVEKLTLDDILV